MSTKTTMINTIMNPCSFDINIIHYIFLYILGSLIIGEYSMYFFKNFLKHLLGGPHFTLFIRSFYISDDG